jgi:hypothetical protein
LTAEFSLLSSQDLTLPLVLFPCPPATSPVVGVQLIHLEDVVIVGVRFGLLLRSHARLRLRILEMQWRRRRLPRRRCWRWRELGSAVVRFR